MKIHTPARTHARMIWTVALAMASLGSSAFTPPSADATASSLCGSWVFVQSPVAAGSALYDASAVSRDDIWSVGQAENATNTLALHWNGTSWSQTTTESPSGTFNDLTGVAAIAADNVWAVGAYNPPGGATQTLVEHWDGSSWSIVSSPFVTGGSTFFATSALSASEIWAAGSRSVGAPGPDEGPLTARWDGSSWVVVDAPYIGNRINRLFGIFARASNDAWSVGTWKDVGSTFHILIMHWDGNAWTILTPPDPGLNDELLGVAALSGNDAWAVGDRYDPTEGPQPLIMHWNGASWSVYPLPVFGGGFITLSAVEAAAVDDIWAAGTQATDSGTPRPLLMHWDGADWSVVDGGATDGDAEYFRGLAVVSSCDVWAVGQYMSGGVTPTTLTERFGTPNADVSAGILSAGDSIRLSIFPNPLHKGATVSLDLSREGDLQVVVLDLLGRRVRDLADRSAPAGRTAIVWDRSDDHGRRLPSGIYFVRVAAGGDERTARVVLK